jgi:flagellar basal-body rod protein FlgC
MDLMKAIQASSSGMAAQSQRMQVISENIANADSLVGPDGGPYRRKKVFFETLQNAQGLMEVRVSNVRSDYTTPLKQDFDPSHPLADENGYVSYPNVNTFVESTDMRDAARSYEANMSAIESAKEMMVRSLDLIR